MNGFVLHGWYRFLDRFFSSNMRNLKVVVAKCAADQIVYAPFSIIVYFGFVSFQQFKDTKHSIANFTLKMKNSFITTWIADCAVWPIANLMNFSIIPLNYRPSFVGIVQLFWLTYLSWVANNDVSDKD